MRLPAAAFAVAQIVAALAALAVVSLVSGCAVPKLPAKLPSRETAFVAVLSGELPNAIEQVARHSWIIANVPGEASYRRWELERTAFRTFTTAPFQYAAEGDVAIHGIIEKASAEEVLAIARCLDREVPAFNARHPKYVSIPGPNSNTFVAEAMRACGIHVELPVTCIGRDYRGPVGAGVTESGTGVQVESVATGVRLGLREGVEAHVFALGIGIHTWPPGITVPINPGRIGVDLDEHATAAQVGRRRDVSEAVDAREWNDPQYDDRPRRIGVGAAWLQAAYQHVRRSEDAGGLSDRMTVGIVGRAVIGRRHIGYAFGSDLEIGMGFPAGFAWTARVYPVGVGWMIGPTGYVALLGGLGGSGVTARVPGAMEMPLEARVELDAGPYVRFGFRGAVTFIPNRDSERAVTSRALGFGDELTLGSVVRFGKTRKRSYGALGHGWFFGLERREILRTYWLGLTFGAEVDFGG